MAGTSYDLVHSLFYHSSWVPFWRSLGLGTSRRRQEFCSDFQRLYLYPSLYTADCLTFSSLLWLARISEWWLGLDINNWSKTIFVLLTMILLFAAIVAEVFKAAYQAIPKGQTEAGFSIGLTPSQTFWRIIFPQAFQVALPNITTAILNLMRDAALAYTIGFVDVMGAGNLLISRNLGNYSLETYTAVALLYWGIALVISSLSRLLEKSLETKGR